MSYNPKLLPKRGERFGQLTVIGKCEPLPHVKQSRDKYVKCKCDCGNTHVTRADTLWSGNTYACSSWCNRRLGTNDLVDKLEKVGSTWRPIEEYVNSKTHIKCKCIRCGTVKKLQPGKICLEINGHVIGCSDCASKSRMKKFGKRFDNQLAKKTPYNIYRIGEYRNMHGKTEFECGDCGHTWKTTPSRAIRSVLRCPACKPNQSQEALDWLDDMRTSLNIPIRDAVHGGELRIPGTRFKADGINKKHGIVFEYHGDAVHGNPAVYELNASPSLYNRSLASDLYIKTIEREFSIREAGFVLVRAFGNDVKEGRPPIVSTNYPSKVADTIASKLGTMPVVFSQGMSI